MKFSGKLVLVGCSIAELVRFIGSALWNYARIVWLFKVTRQKKILAKYSDRDDVEKYFPDNSMFVRSFLLLRNIDESYEDYKYGLTYFLDRYRLDNNTLPLKKKRRMIPLTEWYGLK